MAIVARISRRVFLGEAAAGWLMAPSVLRGATQQQCELFGYVELPGAHGGLTRRLRSVVARHRGQVAAGAEFLARRGLVPDAPRRWAYARRQVAKLTGGAAIARAHDLVNRVPYRTDREIYGVSDRWSTPFELLTHGGDCECYAIAKQILLSEALGLPSDTFRLTLLAATPTREAHAVLAVRWGTDFLILDNLKAGLPFSRSVEDAHPLAAASLEGQYRYALPTLSHARS